jgi:hypothetical protein
MIQMRYLRKLLLLLALGAAGVMPGVAQSDDGMIAPEGGPLGAASAFGGVCLRADLDGASEAPPVTTDATGEGIFILTPDRTQLLYDIAYDDLSSAENGAHLHQAHPGVDGPIAFNLPANNPKQGSIEITKEQAAAFERGEYYVNIHTTTNPEGEIRGQIWPAGDCFRAFMRGGQEVPPTGSSGRGAGAFALSRDRTRLLYDVNYSGLSSAETMAHIHIGPRGVNGGIVFDLPVGASKRGTIPFNATSASSLLAGLLYVNIHTLNVGGGEIRGQIEPASNCFFADLRAEAVLVHPDASDVFGSGYFVLASSGLAISYDIRYQGLSSEEFASHIRRIIPGATASNIVSLPAGSHKRGTLLLSVNQAADLRAGNLYVNIASSDFLFGEIRGRIVPTPCMRLLPVMGR